MDDEVPQAIAAAIEELVLIWAASDPKDLGKSIGLDSSLKGLQKYQCLLEEGWKVLIDLTPQVGFGPTTLSRRAISVCRERHYCFREIGSFIFCKRSSR